MAESPLEGHFQEPIHTWRALSSSPAPARDARPSPQHHQTLSPNPPGDDSDHDSIFGAWSPARVPSEPNNNIYDQPLPSASGAYPSWSQNPDPFANLSDAEDSDFLPPSNQAATGISTQSRSERVRSQYRIEDTESPDPFEQILGLMEWPSSPEPSPQREMPAKRKPTTIDLTEDADSSPPSRAMASTSTSRKRRASSSAASRPSKIKRASTSSPNPYAAKSPSNVSVVDLVDVEDVKDYEALKAKEQAELIKAQIQADASKPVKLAEFQCIICMDNPTDLTVTHCGHLFCSECLHQALHAGDKKCCPVCRQNITVPKPGAKQGKQGIFVLEMKLLTAKKKGKQVVRS